MYFVPVACRLSPWSDPGTRRGSGPTATHVGTYLPRYSLLLRCRARDKEPFSFPAVSFLGFNSTTTRCKADAQHLAWASACQVACPVCALIVRIPTYVGATSGGRVPSPSPQCSLCSDCMLVVHTSYIHTTHTYIPTTKSSPRSCSHKRAVGAWRVDKCLGVPILLPSTLAGSCRGCVTCTRYLAGTRCPYLPTQPTFYTRAWYG